MSIEDLIRLCGCAGWSEFSMGAHANLYLVWTLAPVILLRQIWGQISAPWAKTSPKWWIYIMQKLLFDLILYVPVNSFSVMSWQVYLCWTSTKLRIMCLAHGNKAVPPVRLHPTTIWSRVKHSTTELSPWYMQKPADMDLHCFQKRLWILKKKVVGTLYFGINWIQRSAALMSKTCKPDVLEDYSL